jgi:predicted DNA-binding transcriptional regulator AlpA
MKAGYTVHLTSSPVRNLDEELLLSFSDAVDRERGVAAPAAAANLVTGTLRLTASVDQRDPDQALQKALTAFERALKLAGISDARVVEAEVEASVDVGDRHELLTGAEVARRVGMSRERVRQLASMTGRFPPAIATVGGYRIWRWGDILDWATMQERPLGTAKRRLAAAKKA